MTNREGLKPVTSEQEAMLREAVRHIVDNEAKLIARMMQLRANKYLEFILSELRKEEPSK